MVGCLCRSDEGVRWAALGCLTLPAMSPPLHPPCQSLFTLRPPSHQQRLKIMKSGGRELWCSTKEYLVLLNTQLSCFYFILILLDIFVDDVFGCLYVSKLQIGASCKKMFIH